MYSSTEQLNRQNFLRDSQLSKRGDIMATYRLILSYKYAWGTKKSEKKEKEMKRRLYEQCKNLNKFINFLISTGRIYGFWKKYINDLAKNLSFIGYRIREDLLITEEERVAFELEAFEMEAINIRGTRRNVLIQAGLMRTFGRNLAIDEEQRLRCERKIVQKRNCVNNISKAIYYLNKYTDKINHAAGTMFQGNN